MSREQKLSKKIAHTLLAMSIVYSGGMNVLCNTAFAAGKGADGADKNETVAVSDSASTGSYTGNDGADGAGTQYEHTGESGGNGGGTFIELTGSENMSNAISFTATGGIGGLGKTDIDYNGKGYGGNGGAGGAATVDLTISGADITHAAISLTATGGAGNFAGNGNAYPNKDIFSDETGSNGGDGGRAEASITVSGQKYTAADITLSANGGAGSNDDSYNYGSSTNGSWGNKLVADTEGNIAKIGGGGAGGSASATGFVLGVGSSLVESVNAADVVITATGGKGGNNTASSNYTTSATGGIGGAAAAYGIKIAALLPQEVAFTVSSISVTAIGGAGGDTKGAVDTRAEQTNTGGTAEAYGIFNTDSAVKASVTGDITVTATGGAASNGGNASDDNYDGTIVARNGVDGAVGTASGVRNINGHSVIEATNLLVEANGGAGGAGGNGGRTDKGTIYANGADGGNGGNAYAYGVQSSGGTTELTVDKIAVTVTGGAKGSGGTATSGGTDGDAGSKAAEAKAYGIYAESGAVVSLSAKSTGGTIKIGAKAANAQNTEAYAVYADNATVLFHDNAELNTSDGASTTDNNVLTYLNNATLGFGGTAANRTVIGGTLELKGSNTFRVNTDLAGGTADKFTFDSLAAGNSTDKQYITVGYDAALDPYKVGHTEANGGTPIDVLEITNLNGQDLNNFTGGTTTLDSVIYQFNTTTDVQLAGAGKKVQITGVTTTKTPFASESVKTASDAQMAMGSMWRVEGNNLMKRMGELRSDKEAAKGGVWARYYRGELSADSAYDRNFSQDYTAFQGGIDKVQDYKGGKLYTGIAVNRIDSNAGYTAGSGDLSSTGVGIYTSWLGSKGHYVDVIARGSKLSSDFKLVDLSGNSAKADYDTWAYGISAEYGYRQNLNAGWFIEPQAELSLGHIGSAGYEMSNGARIENEGVDSAVVRLGFLGGKEFTIGGRTSNAYVKASALHDFGGNGGATAYYGTDSLAMQTGDLTGTWYEIGLGANLGIAKNSNLYFDALKTFGGDLCTDWQFNAGLRFSF
ncbi:autotransporter outer membrane beta-barrel domain-containing protein [Phascolarctobacterium faecium]|uniref:autotransporter outer membrane beta-barrel domain-containing protein n=1 Tax=Phascolarctobacterium faecium TaxID=33025 RepID=UPI001659FDD0|nr:autotransporter outer membrane beta-barrel domain-containing protein [Phascolarctobacterium faecium]QNP76757.1 autotransporter outer membrane beta-barrel domain-containing protein [Phascolarctobacterium faecium]